MEQGFKGSLLVLQNRTKRDPESYRDSFLAQYEHFQAMIAAIVAGSPAAASVGTTGTATEYANPQFLNVMNYVCHCCHCFQKECRDLPQYLIDILINNKTTLDTETRLHLTKNLMLLRSKNTVPAITTLPIFFDLLLLRDKALRKVILTHIVGDVRKVNMPGHKNGVQTNKAVQNYMFTVVKEDDPIQARRAELVMIDLYRRDIWCDDKTVQVLTECAFSRHAPIVRTTLRFFLMQMPKVSSVDDTDDDKEENDPGRDISKIKQKLKVKKKTRHREKVLKREVKSRVHKYDKEEREEEEMAAATVDPVRLIRDPQAFAERLLSRLQRTSERFEMRILYLSVIARVVSEHQVVLLSLYPFLERYMEPSQLHSTQLLALSSGCVHSMVPPDAIEPLLRSIANHFVNDRSDRDSITIGINTIREICKRQPLAMNAPLLSDLIEYKGQRGDRGVMMAARALLQLYREVYPELLPARLQGTSASALQRQAVRRANEDPAVTATRGTAPVFGAPKPLFDIPGMELLREHYVQKAAASQTSSDRTTMGNPSTDRHVSDEDSSDDDSDESFETESEEYFSSATSEEGDLKDAASADDNEEEPPMLVPIRETAPSIKEKQHDTTTAAPSHEGEKGEPQKNHNQTPVLVNNKNSKCVEHPVDVGVWNSDDDDADDEGDDAEEEEDQSDDDEDDSQPPTKRRRTDTHSKSGTDDEDEDDEESDDGDDNDDDESDEGEWVTDDGEEDDDDDDEDDDEEDDDEEDDGEDEDDEEKEGEPSASVEPKSSVAAAAVPNDVTTSKDAKDPSTTSNVLPDFLIADTKQRDFVSASRLSDRVADTIRGEAVMSSAASQASSTGTSMSALELLSDADFARISRLRHDSAHGYIGPLRGKQKDADERLKKKEKLIHGINPELSAKDLEAFTDKKREADKEDKIARAMEARAASNPFNIRQKKKSKLNSTHAEHSKRGKLFQMARRSGKVGKKLKSSFEDKAKKGKENKKKNTKFRINRGWKA